VSDADDTSKKRILVIEDEPDIVRGLRDALEFEGFEVLARGTGAEGLVAALDWAPDAVLLDLMLPDDNGYRVCETLRQRDQTVPIIILTAKAQESDKIRGLDAGADDYVTKPFSVAELIARINAIFRRQARMAHSDETFLIGSWQINARKHTMSRGRTSKRLTFYELEVLKLLRERRDETVSRDELLEKVWGIQAAPTSRTVDNFIVKLRRKLEEDQKSPRHILTVYGLGYKLVP
jgi:DNA-binding response OmpR family regulator